MDSLNSREEQLIIVSNELQHIKDDIEEIKNGLHDHMIEEEEYRTILNKRVGFLAIFMGASLLGVEVPELLGTLLKLMI